MAAEFYKLGLQAEALGSRLKELGDPGANEIVEAGKGMQTMAGDLFVKGEIRPSLTTPRTIEELTILPILPTNRAGEPTFERRELPDTSETLRTRTAKALLEDIQ